MTFNILPKCDGRVKYNAALAGAGIALTGITYDIPLPEPVHWAAAGYLADRACSGHWPALMDSGGIWWGMAGGFGALVVSGLMR